MENYYLKQAGDGLPLQTFVGLRYQRGAGFFGRVFVSQILPLLRYLGSKALGTGKSILEDIKTSATNRVIDTVQEVAREAIKRKLPAKANQSGEGIKRKRRQISSREFDFLK
jgi:hypothetical protein